MHNIGLTGNKFMFIKYAYAPITKCCGQNVRGFMSWVILQTFTFFSVTIKVKITEHKNPIARTYIQKFTKYFLCG